jgi:hypothetical protein
MGVNSPHQLIMDYPTLPTDILKINEQLRDEFGIETTSTNPMWRISWSNDQYEMRLTDRTPEGLVMLTPQLRLLPKYRQWLQPPCWILERLVVVPEFQAAELGGKQVSYECLHPFLGRNKLPVQPVWPACQFLVNLIYAAMGHKPMPKYIDPESKEPLEEQKKRIDLLVEELFGDESNLLGRTITGEAIAMPTNYDKETM